MNVFVKYGLAVSLVLCCCFIAFPSAAVAQKGKLKIIHAEYGAKGSYWNMKQIVKKMVQCIRTLINEVWTMHGFCPSCYEKS